MESDVLVFFERSCSFKSSRNWLKGLYYIKYIARVLVVLMLNYMFVQKNKFVRIVPFFKYTVYFEKLLIQSNLIF